MCYARLLTRQRKITRHSALPISLPPQLASPVRLGYITTMMRTITGLTAAYVIALAFSLFSSDVFKTLWGAINWVCAVLVFAYPVIFLWWSATWVNRKDFGKFVVVSQAVFITFAAIMFAVTFSGEQDAGYQLTLLAIPTGGIVAVLLTGSVAIYFRIRAQNLAD